MITAIKIFATLSLLCSAAYPVWGWHLNKRREAEIEPIQDIIREWQ